MLGRKDKRESEQENLRVGEQELGMCIVQHKSVGITITHALQIVKVVKMFHVLDWWKREMRRVIAPQDRNLSIHVRFIYVCWASTHPASIRS